MSGPGQAVSEYLLILEFLHLEETRIPEDQHVLGYLILVATLLNISAERTVPVLGAS